MVDKKAQVSMNMIVYIAIALLVLVLIVAFVTGGFGAMFRGLSRSAPQDLETVQTVCTNDCNKAKTLVGTQGISAWASSRYCSISHGYDIDKSGDLGQDEYLNCWDSPVNIDCSKTVLIEERQKVDADGNKLFDDEGKPIIELEHPETLTSDNC